MRERRSKVKTNPDGEGSLAPADPVRIELLGGFRVTVGTRVIEEDAWRLRKAATLVKLLALSPGHRLHREQAMEALWPKLGKEAASNNLRQTLYAARRTLDPAAGARYLASRDDSLALCPGGDLSVDAEAFEEAARQARRAKEPSAYEAALDLYAGELLQGDRYEEWAEGRRRELHETYVALLCGGASAYEERGDYDSAFEVLRRAVSEDPLREEVHVRLMRLCALGGRRSEALGQYDALRNNLSRELAVEPGASSRALAEEISSGRFPPRARPQDGPVGRSPGPSPHNLPARRTSFVGREGELWEVKRSLSTTRLLTLVGVGGSGKSRLALEAARDLPSAYPDGAWLVELAPLSERALVPQEVAAALGVPEHPGRPLEETLVRHLREKRLLLVLDNCEHLLDACAHLADSLLDTCQDLRILATSREPLGVAGEVVRPVPPLCVPELTDDAEKLAHGAAVRLLVERARLRLPGFEVTPGNARAVAQACRTLEGIPLAIELAAACMGVMTVEQLARRLECSLSLPGTGPRTALQRQRTMRASLEWSYDPLDEDKRKLFAWLSVFAGGWSLEAAEAVCGGGGVESGEVLGLLSGLVDKSLVLAETPAEGAVRYRMLEPVRQYALEKLEGSAGIEELRRKHAAFFAALAEEAEPELRGPRQAEWLRLLDAEHDNLRAALGWALGRGADAGLGLRLAGALGEFWYTRGHLDEGQRWLQAALSSGVSLPPGRRIKALACAAYIAWEQGYYERAMALGEEGLALARDSGDPSAAAATLHGLGTVALHRNQQERAWALLEEALSLRRALGEKMGAGRVLQALGLVAVARRDYEAALALHAEALSLARGLGDELGMALLLGQGALAHLGLGNHGRARVLCSEGLRLSARLGHKHTLVYVLHIAAAVAAARGEPLRSARLWEAAEELRTAIGATLSTVSRYVYGPYIAAARGQVSERAWEAASAAGRGMTPEQAVEYALCDREGTATGMSEELGGDERPQLLTDREEEVAGLVARGLTNRRIAAELSISEHTVANHVARCLRKLGSSSRSQLAAWMVERRSPPCDGT